ncbi:hypothetical protein [Alteribacter populi]|uniref:hypothetical protein n=1 Tax=Alteribacter populi TaxID=2011011 RepID=UPI000BBA5F14|nr:hypothetical protein [Alteribacter populi]
MEVGELYTKSQEKNRRGREVKIAAVHQWEVNGKAHSFKEKRHFIHKEKQPLGGVRTVPIRMTTGHDTTWLYFLP